MEKNFNWNYFYGILLTILVTALLVGGITYVVMNNRLSQQEANAAQEKTDLQNQINDLKSNQTSSNSAQNQVSDLQTQNEVAKRQIADLQNQVTTLKNTMSGMVIDRDGDGR